MTVDEKVQHLEGRVQQLEKELCQVREQLINREGQPWWERSAGMFKDDKVFAEIVRLGQAARRAEGRRLRKASTPGSEPRRAKLKV